MTVVRLRGDRQRTAGIAALIAGTALAFVVQLLAPVGVPLYDGQPVTEPYRYLHPSGDQTGDPTSFSSDFALKAGDSPPVPAFTAEQPPQAQLVAQQGAFVVGAGATGIKVTITPIDAQVLPADGTIAGNVYRFSVTDQAGTALSIRTCDGCITIALRAPDGVSDGKLERLSGGAWVDVATSHAAGVYNTNPVALGDYAIVTGSGGSAGAGGDGGERGLLFGLPFDQVVVAGGASVVLVLLFAAALLVRGRRSAPAPVRGRSIPSKRKKPRPRSGQGPGRPER